MAWEVSAPGLWDMIALFAGKRSVVSAAEREWLTGVVIWARRDQIDQWREQSSKGQVLVLDRPGRFDWGDADRARKKGTFASTFRRARCAAGRSVTKKSGSIS